MSTAEQEAHRRYPIVDFETEIPVKVREIQSEKHNSFIAGTEWQVQQSWIAVTPESLELLNDGDIVAVAAGGTCPAWEQWEKDGSRFKNYREAYAGERIYAMYFSAVTHFQIITLPTIK